MRKLKDIPNGNYAYKEKSQHESFNVFLLATQGGIPKIIIDDVKIS